MYLQFEKTLTYACVIIAQCVLKINLFEQTLNPMLTRDQLLGPVFEQKSDSQLLALTLQYWPQGTLSYFLTASRRGFWQAGGFTGKQSISISREMICKYKFLPKLYFKCFINKLYGSVNLTQQLLLKRTDGHKFNTQWNKSEDYFKPN